ncbi:MAG: hypothetical protein ACK5NK_12490, partial [Niabella sp.]
QIDHRSSACIVSTVNNLLTGFCKFQFAGNPFVLMPQQLCPNPKGQSTHSVCFVHSFLIVSSALYNSIKFILPFHYQCFYSTHL